MIALVTKLDPAWYSPRSYVVAATDALGHRKAAQAEAALLSEGGGGGRGAAETSQSPSSPLDPQPTVIALPRAREVGQSYLTSVFTTLRALWAAVALAFSQRPDLLLVNGPGTCLPVVIATKVGIPMSDKPNRSGLGRKHMMASIDASLKRLRTDYVDLYFIHRFDPLTPAVAISRATRPDQQVVASAIGELSARIAQAALPGPVLVMMGRTVEVGEPAASIKAAATV